MQFNADIKKRTSELFTLRLIWSFMGLFPVCLLILCWFLGDRIHLQAANEEPITLRSILYFAVIVSFPLINLIRHIMLRLNQTMPGDSPARSRYFSTVMVSLILSESPAIYGLFLFSLGDNFNTLSIFCGLSLLACFLYRPKLEEYSDIVDALDRRRQ